jgi:pimeloyl-ACP methyl ester carboxylesterase
MRGCLVLLVTALMLGCGSPSKGASEPAAAVAAALDPELTTYAYPYRVWFHGPRSQGQALRMAYMDVAPTAPPNGRTVLLLHGKNFSAAYWAPTIGALTAAGFRVIAPDQIGFGKSSKPERYQFSFAQLAANTHELLDALQIDRVSVVGHSMGGMLAMRFALLYPERTERLALLNPIGLEDYLAVVPYATIDELHAKELAQTPEKIRTYQREAYYAGQWKPEYEALIEIPAGWTRHPGYPRVAWNAALTADMILTQPVVYELERIQVPTLLVIGQRDRTAIGKDRASKEVAATLGNYPELGRRAAARIPGAQLVALDGVGHLPQVEAFEATMQALLPFLAGTERSVP